jgi:hypothetical protein
MNFAGLLSLVWLPPVAGVLSISAPLFLFAESSYLAETRIDADEGIGTIISRHDLVKVDGMGRAYIEFRALLPNTKDGKFELGVRPQAELRTYRQESCCTFSGDGVITGVIQLGSKEYPLHQDERYSFKLTRADTPIMGGGILSKAYRLADADYWLLLFVSIIANVVQILEWTSRLLWRKTTNA